MRDSGVTCRPGGRRTQQIRDTSPRAGRVVTLGLWAPVMLSPGIWPGGLFRKGARLIWSGLKGERLLASKPSSTLGVLEVSPSTPHLAGCLHPVSSEGQGHMVSEEHPRSLPTGLTGVAGSSLPYIRSLGGEGASHQCGLGRSWQALLWGWRHPARSWLEGR